MSVLYVTGEVDDTVAPGLRSQQVLEDRISGDDDSDAFMGLEAQVVGMQAAMRNRAVIEQAKGVLMDAHHCDAQHALDLLRQVSRDRKVEVGDLAAAVTRTADGADEGTSGVALRAALQEALFPAQAVDGGSGKYASSLTQPLA